MAPGPAPASAGPLRLCALMLLSTALTAAVDPFFVACEWPAWGRRGGAARARARTHSCPPRPANDADVFGVVANRSRVTQNANSGWQFGMQFGRVNVPISWNDPVYNNPGCNSYPCLYAEASLLLSELAAHLTAARAAQSDVPPQL
jgi:hypothetical protein